MSNPFDCPVTPLALSPTNLNPSAGTTSSSAPGAQIESLTPSGNLYGSMSTDPTDGFNNLNLSDSATKTQSKDEIIKTLKAEIKKLTFENKDLKHQLERSRKVSQDLRTKHGKKMEAMNLHLDKLNKMEKELTKLHTLIGAVLGLQSAEPKDAQVISGIISGLEGEGAGVEAKGTKRDAEDEDDEDMDGMGPVKRARLAGA